MVTVIIPARNEPLLNKTIEWLYESKGGEIEIIVVLDAEQEVDKRAVVIKNGTPLGRRVNINTAAKIAKGDYLFILDAHCKMSEKWDEKMVKSCPERGIVVSCLQDMYDTGELRPGIYKHVYLNKGYEEKWWSRKPAQVTEEMMCFTGCSWMIPKDYFFECGGYDESLGLYGWDGPEWACKVWMDFGGKVVLRSDVICGHVFGTNQKGDLYPVDQIAYQKYYRYMNGKYRTKIQEFRKKFCPLPDEHSDKYRERITTVFKVDTITTRQGKNVIKIVKRHYKPYDVKHDGSKTDKEIENSVIDLITEVDRDEVVFDGGING